MAHVKGIAVVAIVAGSLMAGPLDQAWAQSGDHTYFASIDVGFQGGSQQVMEAWSRTLFGEASPRTADYDIDRAGAVFRIGGGVRVWRQLGIGLGYSRLKVDGTGVATASAPHPLFFNTLRTVSTTIDTLAHTANVGHVKFFWMIPINEKVELTVTAGPSILSVGQDAIVGVPLDREALETPPFDTVTILDVPISKRSENGFGGHVSFDLSYMLRPNYGVGVFVGYEGGSVDMRLRNDTPTQIDVGGIQVGGGLRVRF